MGSEGDQRVLVVNGEGMVPIWCAVFWLFYPIKKKMDLVKKLTVTTLTSMPVNLGRNEGAEEGGRQSPFSVSSPVRLGKPSRGFFVSPLLSLPINLGVVSLFRSDPRFSFFVQEQE